MRWTDGGLATTLQAHGLPPRTPVEPWVLQHPDCVQQTQRAFVDAGAELLLTATFRALPHVTAAWAEVAPAAIRLARAAAAGRAEVWLSVGPSDRPGAAGLADEGALVAVGAALTVDGVVLETRVDAGAAEAAVRAARALWHGPLVVSLVPGPDGRLLDGTEPGPWLDQLRTAGADGVGFNCGAGPGAVVAAATRVGARDDLWLKPAGGAPDETLSALVQLSRRARWLGGCCGVDPSLLGEAVRRGR